MSDKRLVMEIPDFPIGIFGTLPEGVLPDTLIDTPIGPCNLVTTKTRYHLYRPVMMPAETTPFNADQQ